MPARVADGPAGPVQRALAGTVVDGFRPDVEGLRAIAVLAVLVFHLAPGALTGGFVGVDVFFVVSGFLITRLLLKELASSGTLALPAFWARRARRLLPAATCTLLVTVLAARVLLSPIQQLTVWGDAWWAASFAANVRFAVSLGDYFGAGLSQAAPSPLLHFWSLAVEEQFYVLWPATMLLVARRFGERLRERLLALVVGLWVASVVFSWWFTDTSPTWSYYMLPSRAAELLTGAAIAVLGTGVANLPTRSRAIGGWLGLLAVGIAVVFFDEATTTFPGVAMLLPVLGTAAVILAGGPGAAGGPARLLDLPVLQWVGRHSYAIYLWHWPTIVFMRARWGTLSLAEGVLAVVVSLALATASVRLVESPIRFSTRLAVSSRRGLQLGAALVATSVLVVTVVRATTPDVAGRVVAQPVDIGATISTAGTTQPTPAAGDLAGWTARIQRVLTTALAVDEVPGNLTPSLLGASADKARVYADGCINLSADEATLNPCRYGKVGAPTKWVLYGDSHAAMWFPAIDAIATARGVELIVALKGGCPVPQVQIRNTLGKNCPQWQRQAIAMLHATRPARVIVTSSATYFNPDSEWEAGTLARLRQITATSADVILLHDTPDTASPPASCLSEHLHSAAACDNGRAKAVKTGRIAAEARAAGAAGVRTVDPTDWFCTAQACPVIVGNTLMYRDVDHITTRAAMLLLPAIRAALTP